MKNIYLWVVLAVVVVIGGFMYLQSAQVEEVQGDVVEFTDSQNESFTIQYDTDKENMVLSLSGTQHNLTRVEAASGAKYESPDGNVVFWEKGGEALVEIDGEIVFEDAMTNERRVEVLKSNKGGDPDANRYDFATEPCDSVDQDCTGDDVSADSVVCGAGTVLEDDVCVPEKIDDDDDGDSIPTEDDAAVGNEENPPMAEGSAEVSAEGDLSGTEATKATDYNSSRSNKNSNN